MGTAKKGRFVIKGNPARGYHVELQAGNFRPVLSSRTFDTESKAVAAAKKVKALARTAPIVS